jgi:hypothetical protein
MGCPYPHRCPPPAVYQPAPAQDDGAAEPQHQQEPQPKQQRSKRRKPAKETSLLDLLLQGMSTTYGVDTLEYRPSDGDADAFSDMQL